LGAELKHIDELIKFMERDINDVYEGSFEIIKHWHLMRDEFYIRFNTGIFDEKKGKVAEAIKWYQKAMEFTPNFLAIYGELETYFKEKGHFDKAVTYTKNDIQFNKNNKDILECPGNNIKSSIEGSRKNMWDMFYSNYKGQPTTYGDNLSIKKGAAF
jgi:tetratricopeptide (TPR) repeat protein